MKFLPYLPYITIAMMIILLCLIASEFNPTKYSNTKVDTLKIDKVLSNEKKSISIAVPYGTMNVEISKYNDSTDNVIIITK